jgi:integrase/recombinase XerD
LEDEVDDLTRDSHDDRSAGATAAPSSSTGDAAAAPGPAEELALTPPLRASSTLAAGMQAFDEYMLRKGFSENTIKAFRNDLKILAGFMESDVKLYQISTQHLEDYLAWMQSERNVPCSAKTLARRITSIKVFSAGCTASACSAQTRRSRWRSSPPARRCPPSCATRT